MANAANQARNGLAENTDTGVTDAPPFDGTETYPFSSDRGENASDGSTDPIDNDGPDEQKSEVV